MKSTVLNTTQLTFLEDLMLRFGKVVTYEQIAPLVLTSDAVAKRQFVSRLAATGWLVRVKKGIYQVADISSLGTLTLSRYALAQILASGSYVSFEAALQFHGMHDQLLLTTSSVHRTQRPAVALEEHRYRFVKTSEQYFFGFEKHTLDGQKALLATPEKALIDMVQLHRSAHSTDRVAEVLSEYQGSIDCQRLQNYLSRSNLTTQRIFGLLFVTIDLPYAEQLVQSAQQGQATSKLTAQSSKYNAKWRLYYTPTLIERYRNTA
jgi:predicted transcriptional regulator of viral defense system